VLLMVGSGGLAFAAEYLRGRSDQKRAN
jgi:spermidine/putrescine transport system permease protein